MIQVDGSAKAPVGKDDGVRMIDTGANPERFARGWHCLGLADGFRGGGPHRIDAFGVKLVVWADTRGHLNVIDSYCRHMGGDLSQGTIKGDEIACPFHDWRWGGDGRCKDIPYAKRVPMRARTQTWPTMVRNGQLFVWNDPEGGEPEDYIPELAEVGDPEWTPWRWNSILIEGANCRELIDNVVDMAHFFYVHNSVPTLFRNVFEGAVAVQIMENRPRADRNAGVHFGQAESSVRSDAAYHGPAYMIDRLLSSSAMREVETILINSHYPVTADSFVLQYGVMVKIPADVPVEQGPELAAQFASGVESGFREDVRIWEHKTRIDNPLLCEQDGPVYQLRRWYEQFYVDRADIAEDMVLRFEFEVDTADAGRRWDEEVASNLASGRYRE